MKEMNAAYSAMLSIMAEMILDEAIRKYKEERLYKEIDCALARGDRNSFYHLAKQLKTCK